MYLRDPNRFHNRKHLSSPERLLGVPPLAPPLENPNSSTTDDELIEDDVVFFIDDYTEPNHSQNHSHASSFSSSSPTTIHHHRYHKGFGFGPPEAFGILAALPENDASPNARNGSHFFHKAPVSVSVSASVSLSSSSSSSSSRLIPAIPRPPSDRIPSSSVMFHQSAPVNVPIPSLAMMKAVRRRRDFDEDNDDDTAEENEEMLPPHEIVARNSAQSPMLAYSNLEGVGRTLKGRDLRQVRNAVWRQTGFLD